MLLFGTRHIVCVVLPKTIMKGLPRDAMQFAAVGLRFHLHCVWMWQLYVDVCNCRSRTSRTNARTNETNARTNATTAITDARTSATNA